MKVGDFVFAEYDNGEIVNGEIVKVRTMIDGATLQERVLLTVQIHNGFRSIYIDKCVSLEIFERTVTA
jgi:hypothetical protein